MKNPETASPKIMHAPAEVASSFTIGTAAELGVALFEALAEAADGAIEEDTEELDVVFAIVLVEMDDTWVVVETALEAADGVSMPWLA